LKLSEIRSSFETMGNFFAQFTDMEFSQDSSLSELNQHFKEMFLNLIEKTHQHNSWFTPDSIRLSLASWAEALTKENLDRWLNMYPDLPVENTQPKTIGMVMAGNIPLVGMHDFISVLLTGNKVQAKLSSKDNKLFPAIKSLLQAINKKFEQYITFTEEKLGDYDAIIATGSNNTSRYFEYYFGKSPNIIRKNRNSIAVIEGNETPEDFRLLAEDIFNFFGLGCRSVSKIFIPRDFQLPDLLDHFMHYTHLSNHNTYANNYDYNRSVYMVNKIPILDTGFLVIKEDESISSPVGCLFYERYSSDEDLENKIKNLENNIQCIVSRKKIPFETLEFGQSQHPMLWDYSDNIDTIKFLLNLYEK